MKSGLELTCGPLGPKQILKAQRRAGFISLYLGQVYRQEKLCILHSGEKKQVGLMSLEK